MKADIHLVLYMKISFTPAALVGSFSNDINFEIHLLLLK
jgi:hypothetical protein